MAKSLDIFCNYENSEGKHDGMMVHRKTLERSRKPNYSSEMEIRIKNQSNININRGADHYQTEQMPSHITPQRENPCAREHKERQ